MNIYKISKYIEILNDLGLESENDIVLIFSLKTGKMLSLKKEHYHNLIDNKIKNIPLDVIHSLVESKVLVYKEINELYECLDENDLMINDLRQLNFIIQPSANCQLGCSYCGQTHSNKKMSIRLMDKILTRMKYLMSLKENDFYKEISITWYGAEPLMGKNEIIEFSNKLINFSGLHSLEYSANIITNGVLLKEDYLEELILKAQIYRYQITLDGLKETHDSRRPTKGGKGSYDVILKNIKKATENEVFLKNNCKILIRVNIDKNNYKDSSRFIKSISDLKIQKYVSVNFAPIVDWGGNGASKESLKKSDFADLEIDWFLEALEHDFDIPEMLPNRGPACMIVNPASEVYDAYGYITPCYEMNYTKAYENSNHIIGNLNKSEEFNYDSPLRKWHDMLKDNKYQCTTCKYLPVCGGSCPKDWFKGEFTCPTLKYNLKDKMLLKFLSKKGKLKELVKS